MPTYEYRCPEGHDFEKFVKMSEAKSELPCPTCGLVALRRVSAGAGLLFKGSGFYITDYGKDGKKDQRAAAAKGEGAKAGESAGGAGSAKAESVPTGATKNEGSKSEGSKSDSSKSDAAPKSKPSEPKAPATPPKSGPAT